MRGRPQAPGDLPQIVPLFPLSGALLLPHTHRPLNVFEPRYLEMIDQALGSDRLIGLIQPLDTRTESPEGQVPLQKIGTVGRLSHWEENGERYLIVLEGVCRFELLEEAPSPGPYRQGRISAARFRSDFDPGFGAQSVDRKRFMKMMRDYAEFAELDLDWNEIEQTDTPDLVNLCCMLAPYGPAEKQVLLEALNLDIRAETLIALAEVEMARRKSGQILQ